jgi:hypothetical protein
MCYWNLTGYYERDGMVRLSGPCVITGKMFSVVVSREGGRKYFEDCVLAQEAFPELSTPEREFLISGVSPEGWQQLSKEDSQPAEGSGSIHAGLQPFSEDVEEIRMHSKQHRVGSTDRHLHQIPSPADAQIPDKFSFATQPVNSGGRGGTNSIEDVSVSF